MSLLERALKYRTKYLQKQASSGEGLLNRAVDYLEDNDVDVILMDVHMPEMDGIQATKTIKEKNLSRAPIIGLTASLMNDERKSYISAGMDVLVEKPVNFDKLIEIVKEQI